MVHGVVEGWIGPETMPATPQGPHAYNTARYVEVVQRLDGRAGPEYTADR